MTRVPRPGESSGPTLAVLAIILLLVVIALCAFGTIIAFHHV